MESLLPASGKPASGSQARSHPAQAAVVRVGPRRPASVSVGQRRPASGAFGASSEREARRDERDLRERCSDGVGGR